MLYLITGGAGFIGSHTVEALLKKGHKVRVLDNLSSGKLKNLPESNSNLEIIIGDVLDSNTLERCMSGVTHILHLAAQVSVPQSIKNPIESHRINVHAYINILELSRKYNVSRVVHASSAAVYGGTINELPLNEKSCAVPSSPYGLEKLVMDQYALLYKNLYKVSTLGLRYFNVYGPRQDPTSSYSGVISKFTKSIIDRSPITVFGSGMQKRDFIYVSDVVNANICALHSTINGVVNIATGKSMTLLDLIETLKVKVLHPVTVNYEVARVGDIGVSIVTPVRMRKELQILDTKKLDEGLNELLDHVKQIKR